MIERYRELMIDELKEGKLRWYFVSTANEQDFTGGWLVRALGPTHAVSILHTMGWFPRGSTTQTQGPFPGEAVDRVPMDQRWTKLTKEQAENLGK